MAPSSKLSVARVELILEVHPPRVQDPTKLKVQMKIKNRTKDPFVFDARFPFGNDSAIVITGPKGEKTKCAVAYDQLYSKSAKPGVTDLGTFAVTGWYCLEGAKKGKYKMAWKLRDLISNPAHFEIY